MPKTTVFSRNKIVLLFLVTVFLCFLATTTISIYSLSRVIDANEQNAARLIASTIHSHILDFLSTHISAAKTMAEDFFLKESLREDAKKPSLDPGVPVQTRFLRGFVRTTNIDTAYIVSDATHRYFSHKGLHKVIDPHQADNPAHEHDTWYPAFIETGLNHNIQLDTNPVENNEWTIFFNNRILDDDDNSLLGVCGVGIKMARLQSLLHDLKTQYGVEIHMSNETETSQIGSQQVFIDRRYLTLTESTAPPKPISFLRNESNGWQCRVGLKQFGWELIIAQAGDNAQTFSFLIANNVLLLLCLFGVMFFVIHRINRFL